MKKNQVTSDALVTFADALKWAEPLMQENPDHVIRRVLAFEPAVFVNRRAELALQQDLALRILDLRRGRIAVVAGRRLRLLVHLGGRIHGPEQHDEQASDRYPLSGDAHVFPPPPR